MYANRFPSGAGDFSVHQPPCPRCSAAKLRRSSAARCAVWQAVRCGGNGLRAGLFTRRRWPHSMGQRSDVTARKRATLWAFFAGNGGQSSGAAGRGKQSARCFVGNGRRCRMCGPNGGGGRNPRCARSVKFYGNQTAGVALRSFECTGVVDPLGRPWSPECSARTLADILVAVGHTPVECCCPRQAGMGGGPVSGARAQPRRLGGAS